MKVLGVDPGTRATGYGVVERAERTHRLLECGVIRPPANGDIAARLLAMHEGLLELIDRHRPDCLAIEGVFSGRNARTAMLLGHARGVAVLAAARRSLPVEEYPPAEVKKSVVGTGSATKDQVGLMVCRHLRLREAPRPADAADGCAIALCHLFRIGSAGGARRATIDASGRLD
ncbi:MAG: crossover junction endodeoxyribonuclease RuvC [Gemmatimonadota bacterium]